MRALALTVAGLLTFVSVPASAQFANQGNWDNQSRQNNDIDRALCDVQRVTRIVGNVVDALRDRGGYGGYNGGYGCQNYRVQYQQPYQDPRYDQRYVPQTYPYLQPQFQPNGTGYQPYYSPESRTFVPMAPGSGNMCIRTSSGLTIC